MEWERERLIKALKARDFFSLGTESSSVCVLLEHTIKSYRVSISSFSPETEKKSFNYISI